MRLKIINPSIREFKKTLQKQQTVFLLLLFWSVFRLGISRTGRIIGLAQRVQEKGAKEAQLVHFFGLSAPSCGKITI